MYVSRKHYERVLFIFGGVIGALLVAAILAYLDIGVFRYQAPDRNELGFATTTGDLRAPESPFLEEEEVVIIEADIGTTTKETVLPVERVLFEYVEVVNSCGPHFEGECLNVRAGPGVDYEVVTQLRDNVVLKVGGQVERDGRVWYKIIFDEWLRYPERVTSDWYVAAGNVEVLLDEGERTVWEHGIASSTATSVDKYIVVDRGEQRLYAYEDGKLFMQTPISTGLALTPTPAGTFSVFKKTPSRYMQGPLPNLPRDSYYDMPGVPWNLYFTHGGAVIHGAYWHDSFGSPYSHGCVNLPPQTARTLYNWAPLGIEVVVKD